MQQRLQKGVYESSTRQIVLDTHAGLLKVGAPSTCMICGELDSAETVTAGALSVTTRTPVGAVMAVSLDGQPLAKARRFVVKMVTVAENTGQNLLPLPAKGTLPDLVLTDEGGSPVRTLGAPSKDETRVAIGGQPLLSVGMTNGTWELYVDGRTARFACDTPGVTVTVRGRRLITGRGGERL
ncbi:MAG: hypothetical protein EB084_18470 [Proteobacteria bacterium]|nr:hypothetical protein [Pseudomonadota bacterium]